MNVFNPTPEEAIHELENVKNDIAYVEINTPQTKVKRWPAITFSAFKMATEALEKQIPKKVMELEHREEWHCPTCRNFLCDWSYMMEYDYCPACGQALDWSEVE